MVNVLITLCLARPKCSPVTLIESFCPYCACPDIAALARWPQTYCANVDTVKPCACCIVFFSPHPLCTLRKTNRRCRLKQETPKGLVGHRTNNSFFIKMVQIINPPDVSAILLHTIARIKRLWQMNRRGAFERNFVP